MEHFNIKENKLTPNNTSSNQLQKGSVQYFVRSLFFGKGVGANSSKFLSAIFVDLNINHPTQNTLTGTVKCNLPGLKNPAEIVHHSSLFFLMENGRSTPYREANISIGDIIWGDGPDGMQVDEHVPITLPVTISNLPTESDKVLSGGFSIVLETMDPAIRNGIDDLQFKVDTSSGWKLGSEDFEVNFTVADLLLQQRSLMGLDSHYMTIGGTGGGYSPIPFAGKTITFYANNNIQGIEIDEQLFGSKIGNATPVTFPDDGIIYLHKVGVSSKYDGPKYDTISYLEFSIGTNLYRIGCLDETNKTAFTAFEPRASITIEGFHSGTRIDAIKFLT